MRKIRYALAMLLCAQLLWPVAMPAVTAADPIEVERADRDAQRRVKDVHALTSRVQLELPSGATSLAEAVAGWADGVLAAGLGTEAAGPHGSAEEMAAYYERVFLDGGEREISTIAKQRRKEAGTFRLTYAYDVTVSRVYETARFVTFSAETHFYKGEDSNAEARRYATFRKADGSVLTWNDLVTASKRGQMQAAVADALCAYFSMPNFASLQGFLQLPAGLTRQRFPLPDCGPGLLKDGLYVQYAPGELGKNAGGAPLAIVPYARMKPLWSAAARQLWK